MRFIRRKVSYVGTVRVMVGVSYVEIPDCHRYNSLPFYLFNLI